ncbi:MAG TPA: transketolase [bacterium]|nr:MAG: Ferredoxin fas2 [bacterium ADurb.Bin236]HOC91108.1 transketolase [bacterium]HOY64231.1 transketolase [bacterium]HPI75358.1 transketolase [bacterium]HPN93296.1 transketolase [bacterium]
MIHNYTKREDLVNFLKGKSVEVRKEIIKLVVTAGGGHVGGGLSMTEILLAMYYHVLNIDPKNPKKEDRDRFILSKGHGGVGICPVLADVGYYDHCMMDDFNQYLSPFGMHPDMHKVPGIDMSTGSLGHGLPISVGLALGARLKKASWRTYCLLGDGECNEGTVWEAAMAGAHFKLGNLTAILDRNRLMLDGPVNEIMEIDPIEDKWKAFGWDVRIIDGHDYNQLIDTFESLPPISSQKPVCVICNTTKGKGVSYMENQTKWHYGGLDEATEKQACDDIDKICLP